MSWEKSFDESEVVDQTMKVFWQKGYAATSISDITAATGIKRGSLYNAFDGKDELFLQSLQKYDEEYRQQKFRRLREIEDPREAIAALFEACAAESSFDPEKRGCLLVNTALEFDQHDEGVQRVVSSGWCPKLLTG